MRTAILFTKTVYVLKLFLMNLSNLLELTNISCRLQGLCGSAKGLFFSRWHDTYKRTVLIVTKGPHEAERWADDLMTFGKANVSVFPEWEDELTIGSMDSAGERWAVLENPPDFLITTMSVLEHKVIPRNKLSEVRFEIKQGINLKRDVLLKWLVDTGYDRTDVVDLKGEFSHRGGIVDIFPPNSNWPVRVEFSGDDVESVRLFHPETQCSLKESRVPLYFYPVDEPAVYKKFKDELVCLEEYLPENTAVIIDDLPDFKESALNKKPFIFLSELVDDTGAVSASVQSLEYLSIPKKTPDMLAMARERVFDEISNWLNEKFTVYIWCNNEGEKKRLEEWLGDKDLSVKEHARLKVGIGTISSGFIYPDEGIVVISDEEIFNRYKIRMPKRKFKGYGVPVREFAELQAGDYVVHLDHGIGKYLGAKKEDGKEMLVIQYAQKAKLYVPVSDVYLVEKYMGLGGRPPILNQLGGKKWLKTKIKVEKALLDMAGELLAIQAKRKALKGIVFHPDTVWQKEMEDAFIYEETPDQMRAIVEVKRDMENLYPMDRLICGDVGYGKTEVAIRAAFKAVMDGKQVAVLVPTTILAQQHYRTFSERLADYPVAVEMLSRFRSDKEQAGIVKGLIEGKVDIVVGTHRLVQPDVTFKDLGLVIVDEEQRFGVRHKEYLKRMRELVDVITMTATPIPRTLYMSLMGIRDMSTINTPPQERLSVETILAEYNDQVIRRAILRELNREGQVYFLHNRVETIDHVAEKLQKLVPEARFLTGHGRMDEETLAYVMDEFVQGKADVLVCTTIIQSGLDIPNVNTIIIDRADKFGLADLYQLRGRVGRYKHQAYAYLLIPKANILTGIAKKRLKAIQDFSHLGAGFKIALQDLEIRGAGNILGAQQHGHIQAVGFDMYCKLLKRDVLKLQGKPVEEPYEVIMDLGMFMSIPAEYIPGDRVRIEFYKKIAGAFEVEEPDRIEVELKDRFGALPEEVKQLLDMARIKLCAARQKIKEIKSQNGRIYIMWLNGKKISEDEPKDKLKWLKKRICGTINNS